MIAVRQYRESDAQAVGRLIHDTYGEFNLSFAPPDKRGPLLGPFQHAYSGEKAHQEAIAATIRSPWVFVAEDDGEIVGVIRGREGRLASLFVRADRHRQGIASRLVERHEQQSLELGVSVIRVASSMYAVPFYTAMGYRRSTGVREGWSFDGRGLRVQPMRKVLRPCPDRA